MDVSLAKPTRIGAYDIVSVIGRGGMGTVYKGIDPRIGRCVAVKVLPAAGHDADLLTRFYREARYTGNLQHPNIVTVYELGEHEGAPYMAMEYLDGASLDVLIASKQPMALPEKLQIIQQVCGGLSYAHKRNLIHRDIKPANIVILPDGTAKIVDFGIARLGDNGMTRTGQVVGSLNYMSPEQLDMKMEVDARTDVYATGIVLFQLLTGVLPFDGGSTAATLMKIVQDPPPPLRKYWKDCPAELEKISQKALAKNRRDRYSSVDELGLDLGRVQQQFENQLLSDHVKRAKYSLKQHNFAAARELTLRVLRTSPQHKEATDLLRQINSQEQKHQSSQAALDGVTPSDRPLSRTVVSTAPVQKQWEPRYGGEHEPLVKTPTQPRRAKPDQPRHVRAVDQGPRSPWLLATICACAVIVLLVVAGYVIVGPKLRSSAASLVSPISTYAEINAEPWGTIKGISPLKGEVQNVIGSATPLRVMLPPGPYTFTISGPNNEIRQVNITVPARGGTPSLVVFKKPDIPKILGLK
jgi:serine/threonine protein kinase